ncbi:MAG: zf-HC2 domain-containing protein [Chloroflexota bacterium]|nr:zf-HC2 domain-containing protein [Chloroflexota bacterium]
MREQRNNRWLGSSGGHVEHRLSAYIDGMLDMTEQQRVREHIGQCSSCRAGYIELKAAKKMLGRLPMVPPPRAFTLTQEMAAANRRRAVAVPGWLTRSLAPRLAWGSVLSIMLLFVVVLGNLEMVQRADMSPAAANSSQSATSTTGAVSVQGRSDVESTIQADGLEAVPRSYRTAINQDQAAGAQPQASAPAPAAAPAQGSAGGTTAGSRATPATSAVITAGALGASLNSSPTTTTLGGVSPPAPAQAAPQNKAQTQSTPAATTGDDRRKPALILEAALSFLAIMLGAGALLASRSRL